MLLCMYVDGFRLTKYNDGLIALLKNRPSPIFEYQAIEQLSSVRSRPQVLSSTICSNWVENQKCGIFFRESN